MYWYAQAALLVTYSITRMVCSFSNVHLDESSFKFHESPTLTNIIPMSIPLYIYISIIYLDLWSHV